MGMYSMDYTPERCLGNRSSDKGGTTVVSWLAKAEPQDIVGCSSTESTRLFNSWVSLRRLPTVYVGSFTCTTLCEVIKKLAQESENGYVVNCYYKNLFLMMTLEYYFLRSQ